MTDAVLKSVFQKYQLYADLALVLYAKVELKTRISVLTQLTLGKIQIGTALLASLIISCLWLWREDHNTCKGNLELVALLYAGCKAWEIRCFI